MGTALTGEQGIICGQGSCPYSQHGPQGPVGRDIGEGHVFHDEKFIESGIKRGKAGWVGLDNQSLGKGMDTQVGQNVAGAVEKRGMADSPRREGGDIVGDHALQKRDTVRPAQFH